MPTIDLTISDAQHTQFANLISGLQAKLDPLRVPLSKILTDENGRAKVKQWIQNHPDEARLLVLVNQMSNYLDTFREDIGWNRP